MVSSKINFPEYHAKGNNTEDYFKQCMEDFNGKKINSRKVNFKWIRNANRNEQIKEKWDQLWNLDFGLNEPKNFL